MKPAGHTSVMSSRAAAAPGELDYFPTPPWAARAGGELIRRVDPDAASCWEPACGEGHMAWGLRDHFAGEFLASDVYEYEPGKTLLCDFLAEGEPAIFWRDGAPDWIVTNPPFVAGEAFVRKALMRARTGVAMLLRSVFLEGGKRNPIFAHPDFGFAVHAQFAERVPMVKGRWDPDASSATAYSWFVWVRPQARLAATPIALAIRAANDAGGHLGLTIPPGAKARLSKREDLARFCGGDGGELFGGQA